MVYRIYSLTLESDFPFPELSPANERRSHCAFELFPAGRHISELTNVFLHKDFPGGKPYSSFAKTATGYLLRFHDWADFLVSADGMHISCYPAIHTSPDLIREIFLDQVVPLLLNLRGKEALHASAVACSNGACAFMGRAGWGKSTLAAAFVKSGWSLLSDDCLPLEENGGQILAIPGRGSLHLRPDSFSALYGDIDSSARAVPSAGKMRATTVTSTPAHHVKLNRIYVLTPPEREEQELRLEVLAPADGLKELIGHAYRLDITDRDMLARQLHFLAKVSGHVPARRLIYSRDYSLLPKLHEAIARDLAAR